MATSPTITSSKTNPFDLIVDDPIPIIASFLPNKTSEICFEGTCKRFHTIAVDLHQAGRELITSTLRSFPVEQKQTEAAIEKFYGVFKRRVLQQLRVNLSSEMFLHLVNYYTLMVLAFPDITDAHRQMRIKAAIQFGLKKRAGEDILNFYVNQPIGEITYKSFKKASKLLFRCPSHGGDVQTRMRSEIMLKAAPAVETLRLQCKSHAFPRAPGVIASNEKIMRKWISEKEALKAKLVETDHEYKIHLEDLKKAQELMDQAYDVLLEKCPENLIGDRTQPNDFIRRELFSAHSKGLLTEEQSLLYVDFKNQYQFYWKLSDKDDRLIPWGPNVTAIKKQIEDIEQKMEIGLSIAETYKWMSINVLFYAGLQQNDEPMLSIMEQLSNL